MAFMERATPAPMDLTKKSGFSAYSISSLIQQDAPPSASSTSSASTAALPTLPTLPMQDFYGRQSYVPDFYNSSAPHVVIPGFSPVLPRIVTPPSECFSGSSSTILGVNHLARTLTPPNMDSIENDNSSSSASDGNSTTPAPCVSPNQNQNETTAPASFSPPSSSPSSTLPVQRPFKAFAQNKIFDLSDAILDLENNPDYIAFRRTLLQNQQKSTRTNTNMRRNIATSKSNKDKDPEYLEKRRRNNMAAKKSRDARRHKEDELALRCAFLEKENGKLRFYVQQLEQRLHVKPTYVM